MPDVPYMVSSALFLREEYAAFITGMLVFRVEMVIKILITKFTLKSPHRTTQILQGPGANF